MKLAIGAAAKTDVGLVRTNNEDNFGYDVRHGIFVVCDGMGGQAAGELASKIAVETLLNHFSHDLHDSNAQVFGRSFGEVSERANNLANAIQLANEAIHDAAQRSSELTGMGSTIVAVSVEASGQQYSIGNVGDSRAYLIRNATIQQLTSDHSLVMEQVRRGLITMEEAEQSKLQNVIVRALGTEESVEPDLQDREFAAGDVLLLCSDGLSRYVKDSDLLDVVSHTTDLEKACEELIDSAKAGNSDDNITCMLLRAVEQPWHERLAARFATAGAGTRHTSA
jgi:serine/threonine protein phosphatase PrpC